MGLIAKLVGKLTTVHIPRGMWCCLLLCGLMSVVDILLYDIRNAVSGWSIVGLICYAVLKATVLAAIFQCTRKYRVAGIFAIVLILVFVLCSVVNFVATVLYDRGISRTLFTIFFETDRREIVGFMPGLMANIGSMIVSPVVVISICCIAVVYAVVRKMSYTSFNIGASVLSFCGCVYIAVVFLSAGWGKSNHIIILRTSRYAMVAYKDYRELKEADKLRRPLYCPESAVSRVDSLDIVMVIGESSDRFHNSLYGYPMKTNPAMSTIADSLFIFSDAIGSSSSTADNMPRILTFMPDSILGKWYEYPSVIQVFKRLGFRIYWLSNQERVGDYHNTASVIVAEADSVCYVGAQSSEDCMLVAYDEALMPHFDTAMRDVGSKHFIMLHLIGSHSDYKDRFPRTRAKITPEDEMKMRPRPWLNEAKAAVCAAYDNSIIYTDSLLYQMSRRIAASPRPGLLIYFSDHGEHIYDNRDHVGRDCNTVTVPMFIYANNAFRIQNHELIERLSAAVDKPVTTANIIHSLLTLSNSSYALYEPKFDFLSNQYVPRVRYVDEEPWGQDVEKLKKSSGNR